MTSLPRVACLFLLLVSLPNLADDCWLTLGYNDEPIPPYIERREPSAGPQGKSLALVDLAAHRIGCKIHWQAMPTLRVLHYVTKGSVDGALFYSWTQARSQYLRYPQRDSHLDPTRCLARLNYVLYRHQGGAVQWDGQALTPAGCMVGYNTGWSIGHYLQAKGFISHNREKPEQLLRLVQKGRLCAYATLEETGDAAIANWPGQFEKLQPPLLTKDYYLPVNQDYYHRHAERVEALWQQIGQLRGSASAEAD